MIELVAAAAACSSIGCGLALSVIALCITAVTLGFFFLLYLIFA